PNTAKACTNCQQTHVKCSEETTCKRCTQHRLVCTFNDSGKKRGPKKHGNYSDQGHMPTLSSPSEYLQLQHDNFDKFTYYSNFYED
ncbi:45616_t:CDS:2, partial [Gigaspora margarita]